MRLLAVLAASLFVSPALAQTNTLEVEPNNSKATATPLVQPLQAGDTISGSASVTDSDYFLVQTAPAETGIYEHTLTIGEDVGNLALSIRGLLVGSGGVVVRNTDAELQSTAFLASGPRLVKWYGFGRSERVYLKLHSSLGGNPQNYTLTYGRRVVTPAQVVLPEPGPVDVTALGPTGTPVVGGGLRAFSSNFSPLDPSQLPSTGESCFLGMTDDANLFHPGPIDSAILATSGVCDFPNVVLSASPLAGQSLQLWYTPVGGELLTFRTTKTGPFDLAWVKMVALGCDSVWTDLGPPGPRQRPAMAFDSGRGRAVFLGGIATDRASVATHEWDGAAWTAHNIPGPGSVVNSPLVYDPIRSQVVLYGGKLTRDWFPNGSGTNLVRLMTYDGMTWREVLGATGPGTRNGHAMAFDGARGEIVLFGGAASVNGGFDASTWTWDGDAWTRHNLLGPSARSNAAMAYDPIRREIVLFGGKPSAGGLESDETWTWNGDAWALWSLPSSPTRRSGHTMAFDASVGRVVMLGGTNSDNVWEWSGVDWIAAGPPPFPVARLSPAVAAFDDRLGALLIQNVSDNDLANYHGVNEIWTRTAGTWARVDSAPGGRMNHAMAYDPVRATTILYGGFVESQVFGSVGALSFSFFPSGDMFLWNGSRWSRFTDSAPGALVGHSLTFDPVRSQTVLFGGTSGRANGAFSNSTWVWDGATWTLAATTGPSGRFRPATAFDPVSGKVLLFGGGTGLSAPLDDTWAWDGASWTQLSVSGPSARYAAAMAADASRGRVVLFGGADSVSHVLNDTWEWDGASWRQIVTPTAPNARAYHSMIYDPSSRTVCMTGGSVGGDMFTWAVGVPAQADAVWDWDGVLWNQRVSSFVPTLAAGGAIAYESSAGAILAYGGLSLKGFGSRLLSLADNPPDITQQPASVTSSLHGSASFSIAVSDAMPTFQWRRNGEALSDGPGVSGSSTSTLTISPVGGASEGVYDVRIFTPCGSGLSAPATLTVRCPADFNGDGNLDADDLGDFITCFFTDPACVDAEFNADGAINADDLGDYITAYFGGC